MGWNKDKVVGLDWPFFIQELKGGPAGEDVIEFVLLMGLLGVNGSGREGVEANTHTRLAQKFKIGPAGVPLGLEQVG